LIELGQLEEALASLDRAISIRPEYDRAWNKSRHHALSLEAA